MDKTIYSIKNISAMVDQYDAILLFGQFLDSFYSKKADTDRQQLLKNEPIYNPDYKLFLCLLAASAEKLSNDYHLPIPEWTEKPEYIFNRIYYAFDTENPDFQKYLLQTTPYEYKKRNLMLGDNVLSRC